MKNIDTSAAHNMAAKNNNKDLFLSKGLALLRSYQPTKYPRRFQDKLILYACELILATITTASPQGPWFVCVVPHNANKWAETASIKLDCTRNSMYGLYFVTVLLLVDCVFVS